MLLNDEIDDFSASPAVPIVSGLLGSEVSSIAPGERMLSSMKPAFVKPPGKNLTVGTAGGNRIITM